MYIDIIVEEENGPMFNCYWHIAPWAEACAKRNHYKYNHTILFISTSGAVFS